MFSIRFKDARYFQLIFQSVFLTYGIIFLHWDAEWWLYITYFASSLITQFICELLFNNNKQKLFSNYWWHKLSRGIPSVMISSFGLSLLLKTNHWYIAALASLVSIASKYLVRINGKHVFNPSALGIVSVMLLTGNAWISPGQWGSGIVILFAVLSLGFIVVTRVQKLDVSLAFLGTFGLLLFVRQVIYLGWPLDYFVQSISTGSLLLFSFFMITDPKTTPNHWIARIAWSMAVAAVAFYLTSFKFMNGAPVFVLVFAQPLVPLLDKIFRAKTFQWNADKSLNKEESRFLRSVYTHSVM
jgi:Na+-transporting NADH:ubiquinone oxidoreductase subunit NqrB